MAKQQAAQMGEPHKMLVRWLGNDEGNGRTCQHPRCSVKLDPEVDQSAVFCSVRCRDAFEDDKKFTVWGQPKEMRQNWGNQPMGAKDKPNAMEMRGNDEGNGRTCRHPRCSVKLDPEVDQSAVFCSVRCRDAIAKTSDPSAYLVPCLLECNYTPPARSA